MKILASILFTICALPSMAQLKASQPKSSSGHIAVHIDSSLVITPVVKTPPVYTKFSRPPKTLDGVTYMINSVKYDSTIFNYINPAQILSINVYKSSQYPKGLVSIIIKDDKILHDKLLTLNDIANNCISETDKRQPIIYLLNKELLTDTVNVRIPEMCLVNVTVAKASEMPYFKATLPNVLIMMITTRPFSTEPYEPVINIRGLAAGK